MELPKNYDPLEQEPKIQEFWEKEKIYKFDPKSKKKIFSIDTPPPTVSGKMHIGHAFSFSQADFVARFKRMRGFNLFYPFGTDDNGLATIRLVESEKKVKGIEMSREEFIKLTMEVLEEVTPKYIADWKRIGTSADFEIYYSTINEHCRRLSQKSFIDQYKDGRVYRKHAPTLWCPDCHTAIAQVELEDQEKDTMLSYLKGKMDDGSFIIYATTRPELHPGCIGISLDEEGDYVKAKRPDGEIWIISRDAFETMKDEFSMEIVEKFKGKDIVGKKVDIKFAIGPVHVSHDISAKTEYGTGVVYYCSFGGLDCVEWLARHPDVKAVPVMDESGKYTTGPCEGMNSDDARKKIVEFLDSEDILIKEEPLHHVSNVHERCGTPIEYIATEQWFIKYLDLKEKFLKAGDELNWYPNHMKNRFDNWIKGLQWDWCISRQRHFGIPIPVWYCEKCHEIVLPDEKQLPVDPVNDKPKNACKCGSTAFRGEKDTLDTWATSSLTPQIAASLFPDLYDKLYPMDLRPQAHDIITFWLFNTLVKSQMHNDINPWKDVMISGWALDPHGKKMSKSKGNVIEPQEVISKYGADCLRFWAAGSKLGEDLPFMEKDIVTGKKIITKLWNASKFAIMLLGDYKPKEPAKLETIDLWILTKLNKIVKLATESFDRYEYSKNKLETEKFFWHVLCDNYLEIIKDRLYNQDKYSKDEIESVKYTLYTAVLNVLKLMAPIMPYITESIYGLYFKEREGAKSIHIDSWPEYNEKQVSEDAEKAGDLLVDIATVVRKTKSEKEVALKTEVKKLTIKCKPDEKKLIESVVKDLKAVTKANEVEFGKDTDTVSEEFEIGVKVEI
ncbi:valine--tRNA ligase [Thermoproteota archaeon]